MTVPPSLFYRSLREWPERFAPALPRLRAARWQIRLRTLFLRSWRTSFGSLAHRCFAVRVLCLQYRRDRGVIVRAHIRARVRVHMAA